MGGFDWGLGWPEKLVSDGQGVAAGLSSGKGSGEGTVAGGDW